MRLLVLPASVKYCWWICSSHSSLPLLWCPHSHLPVSLLSPSYSCLKCSFNRGLGLKTNGRETVPITHIWIIMLPAGKWYCIILSFIFWPFFYGSYMKYIILLVKRHGGLSVDNKKTIKKLNVAWALVISRYYRLYAFPVIFMSWH